MKFDNKIPRFLSALALIVLGGMASFDMGCAVADPEESDVNAAVEDESVAEAEQAVGVGQVCSASTPCNAGLICCGSRCRNPEIDKQHCGECYNFCTELCAGGGCTDDPINP
ncbi:hypothetical protein [Polyangium aurulentum]|uniref:hypothetical protein n=1 Tax=Polyangium aurulentum TaxID=2567896 RepID=UPI0010AE7BC5|nr:hypothetical protein [Polyangium aurulentum]UQA60909.1 hypothetical protein E8A73_010675 [Polyangium aurulentum]